MLRVKVGRVRCGKPTGGSGSHFARGPPRSNFVYEIPNLQKFSEILVHLHVILSDSIGFHHRFHRILPDSIEFCLLLAGLILATGGGTVKPQQLFSLDMFLSAYYSLLSVFYSLQTLFPLRF